ncbi:MAG: DUF1553 domain-containing protein [Verrucomicrobiae bacterium]|nr:DUF1553 domain-containing protein [Verrucomicrobiae bacterium]
MSSRLARLAAMAWGLAAALLLAPLRAQESPRAEGHWAFRPPVPKEIPAVRDTAWLKNPVDAFILARLEAERVRPSPEADHATLLRRVSLDLTGLPPDPDAVEDFVSDPAPDAYERCVDRLLASPHFGERWGRHWLDLARYADSSGYQVDRERPWAWVYRDWVIRSHNADQPFDEFTVWQIAGDLVAETLPREAGVDPRIAVGFHRMTLSNHEDGVDAAEFAARAQVDRVATTGVAWLGLTLGCAECHSHKYDPISQREFYQLYAFFQAANEQDVTVEPWGTAYSFREHAEPPATYVHVRGDFLRRGEEVRPGFLSALGDLASMAPAPTNRLDLARWLVAPDNPLTARVAVNQVWLHLFGRGLVATTEDFGVRGELPSHPELLDWLALDFQRNGWSRKALIRRVVTSAAYRQSSHDRPELAQRDPDNRWLSRQNRVRLDAEILRDASLAVGGQLNRAIGGRSFRPPMPEDVRWLGSAGAWSWTDDAGPVLWRRSLYSYSQRTVPHPLLATFDAANPSESCTRRDRSNTPLQALTLLNNDVFVTAARALVEAATDGHPNDPIAQWDQVFRCCLGRRPDPAEKRRLEALREALAKRSETNALLVFAQTLLNLDEFQCRE